MKHLPIIALLTLTMCYSGQKETISPKEFISLNKNRDFSIFQNWSIAPRGDGCDYYIYDYCKEDEVLKRYIVFNDKNGELVYRTIFPLLDTLAYTLEKGEYKEGIVGFELVNTFYLLNIYRLKYVANLNLYHFGLKEASVIYSEKGIDITLTGYENYTKIDSNWFYYDRNIK